MCRQMDEHFSRSQHGLDDFSRHFVLVNVVVHLLISAINDMACDPKTPIISPNRLDVPNQFE